MCNNSQIRASFKGLSRCSCSILVGLALEDYIVNISFLLSALPPLLSRLRVLLPLFSWEAVKSHCLLVMRVKNSEHASLLLFLYLTRELSNNQCFAVRLLLKAGSSVGGELWLLAVLLLFIFSFSKSRKQRGPYYIFMHFAVYFLVQCAACQ